MPIRISNLRLGVEEPESVLPHEVGRLLGLTPDVIGKWRILRKSLDARDKDALQFVYSVELSVSDNDQRVVGLTQRAVRPPVRVEQYAEPPFELPQPGQRN